MECSSGDLLTQQAPEIALHPDLRRRGSWGFNQEHPLVSRFSTCGPSFPGALVRNAESQASLQTC